MEMMNWKTGIRGSIRQFAAVTIGLVILLILPLFTTFGQESTGWQSPTQTDYGFWKAQNAFYADNRYALAWDMTRCEYWGYGFNLVPGAQIVGIEVRLDARLWWSSSHQQLDVELSWDSGASWTAPRTITVKQGAKHSYILGGSHDEWGRNWDTSDLGDFTFRVRVTAHLNDGFVLLDWVAVRVYYTSILSLTILSGQQVQFPRISGPGMYTSINDTTFQIISSQHWSISDAIVWEESKFNGGPFPEGFDKAQVATLLIRDYDDSYKAPGGAAGGPGEHTVIVSYRLNLTGDNLKYFPMGSYSLVVRYTATPND